MINSVAKEVRDVIAQIKPGIVFGYDRIKIGSDNDRAISKALSRMSKEGTIKRVTKGKYLKPIKSRFGKLKVSEFQVVNIVATKNGKRVGYLTGTALYNRMGVTPQVANTLVIASNKILPSKEIEGYKIKFIKRDAPINERNIPLLQLLDAFNDIKNIPGTSVNEAYRVLVKLFMQLSPEDKERIVELAKWYKPSTRALLGATIEIYSENKNLADKLRKTLNPLSSYKLKIQEALLPNQSKWDIR